MGADFFKRGIIKSKYVQVRKKVTYGDFTQREALNLVRAGAPIDCRHEALPNALNELVLGERGLFENGLDRGNYALVGIASLDHLGEILGNALLDEGGLLLVPPLGNLGKTFLPEMFFESLRIALVGGEEKEQIFNTTTLEGR